MRIKDLPSPVTAAKADWLPGTKWIGFTPTDGSTNAREQRRATINRQINGGYIIEYVTLKFDDPNPGFETNPQYLVEKARHAEVAGKFIAVHRLRPTARPLREIVGDAEYERIQDMWANGGLRHRWSVAFPIIESYALNPHCYANEVLTPEAMTRVFAHPSGTLRPLNDDERRQIAELEIEPRTTLNAWIGIEDEARMAEGSQINPDTIKLINGDLALSALEGMTEEQKAKVRRRAAWLADGFIRKRARAGKLFCDNCGFDPAKKAAGTTIRPRSLLDVHHMSPLEEGVRYTTEADFCLVCPNCHRFMHRLARTLSDPLPKAKALRPAGLNGS
ncbi:HNH endonuclease [Bradyrhizobium japonicum]|uniref:HNH endonuclease n=1 Tax=Bradyrhizobium japonicum TaxID=375 RepID=UPI0005781197|nr:HNH endonuclease [Bradyrhizobium japonicum]